MQSSSGRGESSSDAIIHPLGYSSESVGGEASAGGSVGRTTTTTTGRGPVQVAAGGGERSTTTTLGARSSPSAVGPAAVFLGSSSWQESSPHSASLSPLLKTHSNALSPLHPQLKVRRTRQRVDAGEPRNSYASIANFSSTRNSLRSAHFPSLPAGSQQSLHHLPHLNNNNINHFSHHDYQTAAGHQQQQLQQSGQITSKRARVENIVHNMMQVSSAPAIAAARVSSPDRAAATLTELLANERLLSNDNIMTVSPHHLRSTAAKSSLTLAETTDSRSLESGSSDRSDSSRSPSPQPDTPVNSQPETTAATVTVESTVATQDAGESKSNKAESESEVRQKESSVESVDKKASQVNGCKKRKLYQPQQSSAAVAPAVACCLDDDDDMDEDLLDEDMMQDQETKIDSQEKDEKQESEKESDEAQVSHKKEETAALNLSQRERADDEQEMRESRASPAPSISASLDLGSDASEDQLETEVAQEPASKRFRPSPRDLQDMLTAVKSDLLENVVKAIEMTFAFASRQHALQDRDDVSPVMRQAVLPSHNHSSAGIAAGKREHESGREHGLLARMLESKAPAVRSSLRTDDRSLAQLRKTSTPNYGSSFAQQNMGQDMSMRTNREYMMHGFKNPSLPHEKQENTLTRPDSPSNNNSDGETALSLVLTPSSRRKRSKVTDTRMTPRSVSRLLANENPLLSLFARNDSRLLSPPQHVQPLHANGSLITNGHRSPHAAPPPLVPVSLPTSVAVPNPSLASFASHAHHQHHNNSNNHGHREHHDQPESRLFPTTAGPAFPFSDTRFLFAQQQAAAAAAAAAMASNQRQERQSSLSPPSMHHQQQGRGGHRVDSAAAQHQAHVARAELQHKRREQEHQANSAAMAQAVSNALAAHHLSMLAASANGASAGNGASHNNHHNSSHKQTRASPSDSMLGYSSMFTKSIDSDAGLETGLSDSELNERSLDASSLFESAGGNGHSGSVGNNGGHTPLTATLTPMHLRKAKLMFFYVRYPSSAVLKMFFPDIRFNKNNTAQLVKWFSNFREFYYIQMEKYARQAVAEGVSRADDITVPVDAELIRVLNLHYNRNNHIEVCFLALTCSLSRD